MNTPASGADAPDLSPGVGAGAWLTPSGCGGTRTEETPR